MAKNKNELLLEAKKKEEEYKNLRREKYLKAKSEPNRWKRFWKICWHLFSFPFVWIWHNLRDWHTIVIFVIVFLLVSSEVWIPYILAFVFGVNSPTGITLMSVASACWLFWLGPGTPFLPLCIVITIGIKALWNKIRFRKIKE